ncbi:MAG: hypothetical protein WAT68_12300 [Candidatus Nitrotoga sp.]
MKVLSSQRAVKIGMYVVRAFVRLSEVLTSSKELTAKLNELEHKVDSHDQAIAGLINAMREMMRPPEPQKKRSIGFMTMRKSRRKTVESNPLLAAKKEATRFRGNGGGWLFVY